MKHSASPLKNASVPEGVRIYAVGDIHGRSDLVDGMIAEVVRDHESRPNAHPILIFLGDYIDRGPDSRGVVNRLIHGLPPSFDAHFIKGNHEDLLLQFLRDPDNLPLWIDNGGDATLASYGVEGKALRIKARYGLLDARAIASQLEDALPEEHLEFFLSLDLCCRFGDYFFVHAGVRPGIPLDRQDSCDLLWIRDEFLNWPYDFGAVVVHGHTPAPDPQDLPNRIGIDTLAVMTGRLTAVGLEGEERWFLGTGR